MHGAPWGTMNGWLRLEVEERAQRYGRRRRTEREVSPPVTSPRTDPRPVPALAREDVTACA